LKKLATSNFERLISWCWAMGVSGSSHRVLNNFIDKFDVIF
jgi:hypothetical protein